MQYENHPFQPAPVSRKSDQARHDTVQHRKQAAPQTRHAEHHGPPYGASSAEHAQYHDGQPPAKSRQPRKTRHAANPNQEK